MKLIDADKLRHNMYDAAFIQDSDLQKWDGGCWIRYKMFERILEEQDEAIVITDDYDCGYDRGYLDALQDVKQRIRAIRTGRTNG